MDDFKKYIRDNMNQLDTDVPGDHLWESVAKKLQPAPVRKLWISRVAAACIFIMLSAGGLFYFKHNTEQPVVLERSHDSLLQSLDVNTIGPVVKNDEETNSSTEEIEENTQTENNSFVKKYQAQNRRSLKNSPKQNVASENNYMQVDNTFSSFVSTQMKHINNTPVYTDDAEYFSAFKNQFAELNNDEQAAKADIRLNGPSDEAMERMINIYQQKISLLKQLRTEINKVNNKARNSETAPAPAYINL